MPIGKAGSLVIPCAVHLMLHGTDAAHTSDWKKNISGRTHKQRLNE